MEVKMELDDDLLSRVFKRTGAKDVPEILKEGLGYIDWITAEAEKNRGTFSSDEMGEFPHRIITPLVTKTFEKSIRIAFSY